MTITPKLVTLGDGTQHGVWDVRHPDGRAGTASMSAFTREAALAEMRRQFDAQDRA